METRRAERFKKRMEVLKKHHDQCASKYERYVKAQIQETNSDSNATMCLSEGECDTDPAVPPLERTDSVFLSKEHLGHLSKDYDRSEASFSCIESSEDEGKWNNPQLLPFTEDVKQMHMYLEDCRQVYQNQLKTEPNKKNWSKLANITLCEVILFNRRREGEVSKMPLSSFTLRDTSAVQSDVALGLSELEQKLCQHFQRIDIMRKRNRKVPILLTPDMLSSMETLVAHRRACGVPDDNPFFFSRPEADTHLRGSDAIRHIARECGAKHPETLCSTKLRKQLATLSTVLNLKDNEMDTLASFLGHDTQVHMEYYRLPEGTLQLAKVSKILFALEQGRLSEFKGMSMEQIQIDPQEKLPENIDTDPSDTENSSFPSHSSEISGSSKRILETTPESESTPIGAAQMSDDDDPTPGPTTSQKTKQLAKPEGESPKSRPLKKRRLQTENEDKDPKSGPSTLKKRISVLEKDTSKTETSNRQTWSHSEIRAVEKTLKEFIELGKVPGKKECDACIIASPEALKNRSWKAVKFYVKNRITAIQREEKKRYY